MGRCEDRCFVALFVVAVSALSRTESWLRGSIAARSLTMIFILFQT
jgi:hypothetical protein